jgi:hypothetical protein
MNFYLEVNGQKLMSLEKEVWKKAIATYWVSNMGRIATENHRGSGKLKLMKPAVDKNGYLRTAFQIEKKLKTVKVHREVAKAFIKNPLDLETVNHKNFIKTDNRVENLEWMSQAENKRHAYLNGRHGNIWKKGEKQHENCLRKGEDNGSSKLTEKQVLEIRAKFKPRKYTREMLAIEYNVKASTIKDVILRRSWNHVR